jgi:hypothetical protein
MTMIFTDLWEVQVFEPLEDVMKELKACKEEWRLYKYKRLENYNAALQIFWEFVIDLENTKILWYKETHIIDDLKKEKEMKAEREKLEAERLEKEAELEKIKS